MEMTTIVSVSGGLGSAQALRLALRDNARVVALFADVKGSGESHFWSDLPSLEILLQERFGGESRDTYRFLWQLSYALNIDIERIGDNRSIWAIAAKERMFRLWRGQRAFCKASEQLKRELLARWIEKRYCPGTYCMALGMGVLEPHRIRDSQNWWRNRLGWSVEVYSPIIQEYEQNDHLADECDFREWAIEQGVDIPQAYADGLPHNNCGSLCFMAGQSQYALLYRKYPERYLYAAWQEMRLNTCGRLSATILSLTRGGEKRPISLYDFTKLVEANEVNEKDLGHGCSCVVYPTQLELF